VPVYNVSTSLLKRHFPDRPLRILEFVRAGTLKPPFGIDLTARLAEALAFRLSELSPLTAQ
jgi:hypothetical protein